MYINSIVFQQAAIGDYLFLIMIVVASIIQAIVQNKKKKGIQESAHKERAQNNPQIPEVLGTKPETMKGYDTPIDNIFDSIERVLKPEIIEEDYEWDDDYSDKIPAKSIVPDVVESSKNTEQKLVSNNATPNTLPIPHESVTDIPAVRIKSRIREGFNLRKAVVYSEILNRKYT